jgi:hypothetical protein
MLAMVCYLVCQRIQVLNAVESIITALHDANVNILVQIVVQGHSNVLYEMKLPGFRTPR